MAIKTKLRIFYTFCLALPLFLHAQKEIGNNLRLYTGAEYIPNGQHAQGYPFFQSDLPLDGSLFYDGAWYDHIFLQYDLTTEEVVIHDSISNASIRLVKEKLPTFSIAGHTFLCLPAAADSGTNITPGYYELLHDGPYRLIGRHEKKLIFPTTREDVLKYVSSDGYFLRLHNQYIRIEGRRSLLNALADKKDLLKKFIRQNKLDFDKDPDNALIQTIHYYTQLKN